MSGIEDNLGAVMAEHDHEAPGTADLIRALQGARANGRRWQGRPETPRRLARWLVPLSAAAAVAAVIAGSMWAGGLVGGDGRPAAHGNESVPRMSCPARYAGQAPWVPDRPAGLDGRARLVPRVRPGSAVVCAYAVAITARYGSSWALSGRRTLTGGLGWLAAQLSWQPRAIPGQSIPCLLPLSRKTNYLIGLAYRGGGTEWVSATDDANGCTGSSNGQFTSSDQLGGVVSRAFSSGQWPALRPPSCDRPGLTTRLGQGSAMIPAGSTSLTICPSGVHLTSGFGALVSALNSLPTRTSTRSCSDLPGPPGPGYRLLFSYPQGPPVQIWLNSGCDPAIDNLSLQAVSASTIVPIIRHLLGRR